MEGQEKGRGVDGEETEEDPERVTSQQEVHDRNVEKREVWEGPIRVGEGPKRGTDPRFLRV